MRSDGKCPGHKLRLPPTQKDTVILRNKHFVERGLQASWVFKSSQDRARWHKGTYSSNL